MNITLFAQAAEMDGTLALIWLLFVLTISIAGIFAQWRVFEKADEAGWKILIPFYNVYTLCRIAGRNGWWMLLFFIPFVNIIAALIISINLAEHFGKSAAFGVIGLWLFILIGYMILGFGDAKYVGVKHA